MLSEDTLATISERAAEIVLARLPAGSTLTSPYLSVTEAAEYLRAKPQRVHDLLSARKLTRYKEGRRTLVSRTELEAHVTATRRSRVAPTLPPPSQSGVDKGLAA
jgi:excisionase family DNA binding protein